MCIRDRHRVGKIGDEIVRKNRRRRAGEQRRDELDAARAENVAPRHNDRRHLKFNNLPVF